MRSSQLNNVVTIIGDVVRSRQHDDRVQLHETLLGSLDVVNEHVPAVEPLRSTIGDEFQALYENELHAERATLLLRLHLAGSVDVRFGIGRGRLTLRTTERAPFAQDGPAWWAARAALQRAERLPLTRLGPRHVRTCYKDDSERVDAAREAMINAFLFCRDHIVGEMDSRDQRLVFGLFTGRTVADLAEEIDVSPSAVSQRNARSGAYALLAAARELSEVLPP